MNFAQSIPLQVDRLAATHEAAQSFLQGRDLTGWRGMRIGLVGIGASIYAARAAASYMRSMGIVAYPFSATELLYPGPALADIFIMLSATGRSREVIDALAQTHGKPVYAVSVSADNPLAGRVEAILPTLNVLDSSPSAPSFPSTLMALGVLADHIAGRASTDWTSLPTLARETIEQSSAFADRYAARLDDIRSLDYVAADVLLGTAEEAALLTREVSRVSAAAFDTRNYLHGPMEVLDAGHGLIVIGDGRELELARDMHAIGAPVAAIARVEKLDDLGGIEAVAVPAVDNAMADAILRLIPLQVLFGNLASRRNLSNAGFRYRQQDTKLPLALD